MAGDSSADDTNVASVFFGAFLGLFVFSTAKASRQTMSIWERTRTLWNWYLCMVWIEIVCNFAFALATYLLLRDIVAPSLGYYIAVVTLWAFITQLLLQIVANRVGLIMVNKRKSRMIKWGLFIFIALVNISVYCIWIPGLMEISPAWVRLNIIYERVEKGIFLVVDLVLNIYFLYLVRSDLISKGLRKYWPLFNFTAGMVFVSTSMDILLLGLQSLPNTYDYIQFAPIAYIAKLQIELKMAELISKIVRSPQNGYGSSSDPNHQVDAVTLTTRVSARASGRRRSHQYFPGSAVNTNVTSAKVPEEVDEEESRLYRSDAIMKTVTMSRVTDVGGSEDSCSGKSTNI